MDWKSLPPGDPALIDKIVQEYMAQGKFDQLRRQLLADVDSKASYQNVKQRMENNVRSYLERQRWRPDLAKNQLRDGLKRHVVGAPFLRPGVNRIVSLLVNDNTMVNFRPDLEAITRNLLGIAEKTEPEPMDTQPDLLDSPDDTQMVIATDEDTMNEMVTESNPATGSDEEKLAGAMEDLTIPEIKDESQNDVDTEDNMNLELEISDEESQHSIIKQMSPISAGTPSPPSSPPPVAENQTKRAFDFIGKIPKVKKEEEEKPKVKEEEKPKAKKPENKKEEEEKPKVKKETEDEKSSKRDEKRGRSREKKSSRDRDRKSDRDRDRDRRSYKSSRRDRDSDRRDKDRKSSNSDRRRDSDRNREKSKDDSKSKKEDNKETPKKEENKETPKKEENKETPKKVEEPAPIETTQEEKSEKSNDSVIENIETTKPVENTEEDKTQQTPNSSTMTTRSRLRPPVTEEIKSSGSENVYSKKYFRPARRDIR